MDELIKLVSAKAGISEKNAKVAVETVISFIKDRLPEPLAGRLDAILEGRDAGDVLKGLGGLFG